MKKIGLLFIATFILTVKSSAQLPKGDEKIGEDIPNISLIDHQNRSLELKKFKGLPTILVPFYSNCHSSCPLTIKKLLDATIKSSLDHRKYQVLLFSIDPKETANSLRIFRRKARVPANWITARAKSSEIQTLTSALNYFYISDRKEYLHPDVVAFLTSDLKIANFMGSNRMTPAQVEQEILNAAKDRPLMARIGPWILMFSIFGLLGSTWATTYLYCRRQTAVRLD